MTLSIRTTRAACNTSTGTQDITISGFGTPKAAFFAVTRATADGTAADGALLAVGATDGTRNWGTSHVADNGLTTTDNRVADVQTSYCVYALNTAGSIDFQAAFSAWITDGIRIDWNNAPDAAYLLTVVLLGGDDLSAYAGTFAMSTTLDAAVDVTAVGFKPTVLLTAEANANRASFSLGMVYNSPSDVVTQGSIQHSAADGATTTAENLIVEDDYGIGITRVSAQVAQGEFGSFDASGFSCTTRGSNTYTATVGYLALGIANHDVWMGTITTPTSTGSASYTGPSFKPQFVMQLMSGAEAADTVYTDNRAGAFGLAVADDAAQYSNTVASEDGVTTTNTESVSDNLLALLHDDDGAGLIAASLTSFDATGWTANFTAVSGTGKKWLALAVEEESSGAATSYPFRRSVDRIMHNLVR